METIINQPPTAPEISDKTLADFGFYWREKAGVKVLVCRALEANGFTNGFSTRLGGVSKFPENDLNLAGFGEDADANIFENRRRFLAVFEKDFALATVWQVHGDAVKTVKTLDEAANGNEKADALVSNLPNVLAAIKTADCVPVLIGDPKTGAFAAVHAGWRGTAESIVRKSVEKMRRELGAEPADLICAIGAAATCANYEVGTDVFGAFHEKFADADKFFKPTRPNHWLVDLHSANKEQLISAGVSSENIHAAPFCTIERTDLFFSYRKEKQLYGKTGRLLSVIGKKQD